jgi:hypothetical protein
MSGFTIYLDEMEERDRKQRRRAKVLGAIAIIAFLIAMRRPEPQPPPAPKIERIVDQVAVPVFVTRTQTVTTPVIVRVQEPRVYKLLPAKWIIDLPPSGLSARHLCVTPKQLTILGATNDRVIVSNVGDKAIRITAIGTAPLASGFVIDDADCANRQLEVGERCTIVVTPHEARKKTMYLLVASDAGDHDVVEITASASQPTSASASPASRGPAS